MTELLTTEEIKSRLSLFTIAKVARQIEIEPGRLYEFIKADNKNPSLELIRKLSEFLADVRPGSNCG